MPQSFSRRGGERGFTLMELMVVVVLIGILAASILPQMTGTYQDALLRSTGRELVNAFGLAYSRAVSLNQAHRIRLDTVAGRYLIERRGREAAPEEFTPVRGLPGGDGKLDNRISVRINRAGADPPNGAVEDGGAVADGGQPAVERPGAVSFYPDGTADAVELELRDQQGFRLALRVNPTTARVRIVELGRE